jgi:hypothetical protein
MFPEIKPLAKAMESANRFFTVLFRSVIPQMPLHASFLCTAST